MRFSLEKNIVDIETYVQWEQEVLDLSEEIEPWRHVFSIYRRRRIARMISLLRYASENFEGAELPVPQSRFKVIQKAAEEIGLDKGPIRTKVKRKIRAFFGAIGNLMPKQGPPGPRRPGY